LCVAGCVCACVAGIIINYNGFQTERTASECNFLNVGINQEAEGFTVSVSGDVTFCQHNTAICKT